MAEQAVNELIRTYFGDCCEHFEYGNTNNLIPGEEPPKPKIHVKVKITEKSTGEQPTTFVQAKLLQNILGCQQDGRKNEDKSLRMMLTDQKLVDKLINTKTRVLNDIEYEIETVPDKKVNQGRGVFHTRELDDWTEEQLMQEIKRYGAISVYPFTRKVTDNSGVVKQQRNGTYKVVFETHQIPTEMFIGYARCKVGLFYDNPMFCKKCALFGHTEKGCRAPDQVCLNCGSSQHETTACDQQRCCMNCFRDHDMNPRSCQVYQLEKKAIQYATQNQVPVRAAVKHAVKLIHEHMRNITTNWNQVVKNGGSVKDVKVPAPAWYTVKSKETNEKPKFDRQRPPVVDKTYYAAHMRMNIEDNVQKKRKSMELNPHRRAELMKNKTLETMNLSDSSDDEPQTKKDKKR